VRACHSVVNDSAVPCAAESDFLIKTVCRIIHEDIRTKVGCTLHSGVNDFEGTQGKLFDEKKTKDENHVSGSL
jgi:hypothetical protein